MEWKKRRKSGIKNITEEEEGRLNMEWRKRRKSYIENIIEEGGKIE